MQASPLHIGFEPQHNRELWEEDLPAAGILLTRVTGHSLLVNRLVDTKSTLTKYYRKAGFEYFKSLVLLMYNVCIALLD